MPRRILILEDNAERKSAMTAALRRILPRHEVHITGNAYHFIDVYFECGAEIELMSLGHDLTPTRHDEDTGNGRQVAHRLAATPPTCPIIIHSGNIPAANGMVRVLRGCNWPVWQVFPSHGWNWIDRDWSYEISELIRKGWITP